MIINKDELLKNYLNEEIMAEGDYVHRVEIWAGGAFVLIQSGNNPVQQMEMSSMMVEKILKELGVQA